MKKFAVAVDGPAGSGKSTVAKEIAKALGILYIDTGAMYRTVGMACLKKGIDPADESAVVASLNDLDMKIFPEAGGQRILLDGEDITGLDITQRAHRGVSFAFQQPVRFKGLTVKDLITLASGQNIGVPEACNYLSEVGLCAKDYIDREVDGSLSGGELKRIEIAMIMARGTKLSVFDEPEAGIDLWSFSNLIQVFEHLHEKINGSILIISHQERILNIADRIIVLADGQVRSDGGREEILPQLLGEAPSVCSALSDKVR